MKLALRIITVATLATIVAVGVKIGPAFAWFNVKKAPVTTFVGTCATGGGTTPCALYPAGAYGGDNLWHPYACSVKAGQKSVLWAIPDPGDVMPTPPLVSVTQVVCGP